MAINHNTAALSNPSKCEDHLTKFISIENEVSIKYSQELNEVRNIIKQIQVDPFEALIIVDALQKLCIDYHFRDEIDSILKMLHKRLISNTHVNEHDQGLYKVSLCFRILRQEGYYVPAAIFRNFQQKDGKFKCEIAHDVKGLIALYEASQLSIGEGILEEAADFSYHSLERMMPFLDHEEGVVVKDALQHSYQKSSTNFMVKKSIKDYAGTIFHELAELEFNKVQSIHRREVHLISRWWKDLGLAQELKLARNQPLKWYLWAMASLTDPSLSEQRLELTKPIALIFIIDDIFDVYGNLDELVLFTEAVHRWDINSIEKLPHYMRVCFEALYSITLEIGQKIYLKYGFNPIEYLKETWKKLFDAFLVEAMWFASGHLPTADDYLKNGIISSGAQVAVVHMFFLLGGGTSKESADIINDNQHIISCLAKILRLWDDLGSAEDENQDGHDGSYVTYYMKENKGCSLKTAKEHVMGMISDTWKNLNKECISPNPFSATFTKACLNLAKMVPLMYNYDEKHCLPLIEDYIKSMF